MKKVINYILLSAIMVTFLPYSILAATTNVGVNITGEVSIEVVTTISADITLDLTTGETTPTYMEIRNNSLVPVSAKITNISTTSEGAPSTFVKASDKEWINLSKTDTKKYVNFNIIGEGQNVSAQDILPNTEIELGTLDLLKNSISTYGDSPANSQYTSSNIKYYEINANFGKNWDSGDKNFIYQIETVYSQADEYIETALTLSSFQSEVTSFNGVFIESYDHTNIDEEYNFNYDTSNHIYFNLSFNVDNFNKSVFYEDLKNVSVSINNQNLDYVHFMPYTKDSDNIFVVYSIPKPETGVPKFYNFEVMIGSQSYTFIEKVVVFY